MVHALTPEHLALGIGRILDGCDQARSAPGLKAPAGLQLHEILFRLCHRARRGPITRALGITPGGLSE
jgi:hypothetical protein